MTIVVNMRVVNRRPAGDGIAANVITNFISSFSSEKNKMNLKAYSGGLDVVTRMTPIRFEWKETGAIDIDVNAEDVDPSAEICKER